MKVLPWGATEQNATYPLRKPRVLNSRYTVRLMYLGVIACPQDEDNFDVRIILERVSHAKVLTRDSKIKKLQKMCTSMRPFKRASGGS